MSSQVGSGHIAIFPVMRGFKSRVTKDVKSAGGAASRDFASAMKGAGRSVGARLGRDLKSAVSSSAGDLGASSLKRLNREVASSSAALSKARLRQQDTAGRVRVAEARLQEVIDKSGATSSRAIAAEERLASARRAHKTATDQVSAATARLKGAQDALTDSVRIGSRSSSSGFGEFRRNVSNALAPVTALGGAFKNLVSRAVSPAVGQFRAFATTALAPVRSGLQDLALKGAYKASSALVRVSNSARSVLAPALEKLSPITAVLGRSFSGISGLAKQAFGGLPSVVRSSVAGVVTAAGEIGSRAGQALGAALKGTATAAVTVASTAIGIALGSGFNRLTTIDQARAKLVGLGHDGTGVAAIMRDATSAVKGTAFGLGEAATVAAGAVASGIKPGKQLESTLKGITNVAAATNRTMEDTGAIFNNVRANQAAYTQDIKQLANAGLPIWDALQKTLGKTQDEVRDLATSGAIDFDTFMKAASVAAGTVADEMGNTVPASAKNMFASLGRIGANLFGGIDSESGQMFGLYARIAPLIQSVTGALGPLEERAKGWGEILDRRVGPAMDWVTNLLDRFRSGSDDLKGRFSELMPVLAPVGAAFAALGSGGLATLLSRIPLLGGMLGGLTGPLAALGGPLGVAAAAIAGFVLSGADADSLVSSFSGIIDQVVSGLPGLVNQFVGFIPKLVQGLLSAIPSLLTAATGIVGALVDGIVQVLPILISGGVQLVKALLRAIIVNLPMIIEGAIQLVNALITGIITLLPLIIQGGVELLMALITGIINALPLIIEGALTLITTLLDAIITLLPVIIEAGIELLLALVMGLIEALPQLITAAVTLIGQLVAGLMTMLPQLIVAGIELVAALIIGLVEAIPQLLDAVIFDLVPAIIEGFKGVDWATLGMDIVNGIIGGLGSMVGALKDAIVGLASSAWDGFKDFWGIASPSKRMRGAGINLVEGATGGVDAEAGEFSDSLVAMAREGSRRAEAAMSVASSTVATSTTGVAGGAYAPAGTTINQTNNFASEDPEVGAEIAKRKIESILEGV